MTDALMGFTLGIALLGALLAAGKAAGTVQERRRRVERDTERAVIVAETALKDAQRLWSELDALRGTVERSGVGAADAAIAQLAARIAKLEKAQAETDLTVLDTVEKVTHKLQDRRRKREAEIPAEDHDEIPLDPNLMLARARAAYGVVAPDPAQLQLIEGAG